MKWMQWNANIMNECNVRNRFQKVLEWMLRSSACPFIFINVFLICTRDMIHSYTWPDSFICVTWLSHMRDALIRTNADKFLIFCCNRCVPLVLTNVFLICKHDVTHPHVWHNSSKCVAQSYMRCHRFIWATWLIGARVIWVTHSYVKRDSSICVTWLIYLFDMTRLFVWHDSFICVTWLT